MDWLFDMSKFRNINYKSAVWYWITQALIVLSVLFVINILLGGALSKIAIAMTQNTNSYLTSALPGLYKGSYFEFASHWPSWPWEHAHVWRGRPEWLRLMTGKKEKEHYTPFYSTVSQSDADAGAGIYGPFASMQHNVEWGVFPGGTYPNWSKQAAQ